MLASPATLESAGVLLLVARHVRDVEGAELHERARVGEPVDPLAGIEPPFRSPLREALGTAHAPRTLAARLEVLHPFVPAHGAALPSRVLRIEGVAQAVAQEIEGERRQQDGEPRHEDEPGCQAHEAIAAPHVGAPRGRGRLDADAEEAQARLGQEREGDGHRDLHDDGRRQVGQDVADEDAAVRGADGMRALDEELFAERQRLAAHEPREARHVDDADGDHDVDEPGTERGGDGHGEHEGGEGLDGVYEAHQEIVERAARVARP